MKKVTAQMLKDWQSLSEEQLQNSNCKGMYQEPDGTWSITDGFMCINVAQKPEGCTIGELRKPLKELFITKYIEDRRLNYTAVEVDLDGVKAFRKEHGNKCDLQLKDSCTLDSSKLLRFCRMMGRGAQFYTTTVNRYSPLIAYNSFDDGNEVWGVLLPLRIFREYAEYGTKKEQEG